MDEFITMARQRLHQAAARNVGVLIRGGGSKEFYGGRLEGEVLDTTAYRGVVNYDPSELVLTVRAGTPLAEVEATLATSGQMLAFEPPHFGAATVGGLVATGLSGPRRPYAGAVRDAVLGVELMDGRGQVMRFGGRVMKNVAGFDMFRPQVSALGTLGLLLEVSFKVLPTPEIEVTRRFECSPQAAIDAMNRHAGTPIPLSGASYHGGVLRLRLSGNGAGVRAAERVLGGDEDADGAAYWRDLREQTLPFFLGDTPLWRLSLPSTRPPVAEAGEDELIDWGGAQRWLRTTASADAVRARAAAVGGYANCFRHGLRDDALQRPAPALMALHWRLKRVLDPIGVLNRGRLFPDF